MTRHRVAEALASKTVGRVSEAYVGLASPADRTSNVSNSAVATDLPTASSVHDLVSPSLTSRVTDADVEVANASRSGTGKPQS